MGTALPQVTYVEVLSAGHGPIHTNARAKSILARFIEDPHAQLDINCASQSTTKFVIN
jgi:hypothetical protein